MKTKITVRDLKQINTLSELQEAGLGRVLYDIGGRGGYVGFSANDIGRAIGVDPMKLNKVGAYCNYLGGGVRGKICLAEYHHAPAYKHGLLKAICEACKRVYLSLEDELFLNDDSDEDINWDARATAAARGAGVRAAY